MRFSLVPFGPQPTEPHIKIPYSVSILKTRIMNSIPRLQRPPRIQDIPSNNQDGSSITHTDTDTFVTDWSMALGGPSQPTHIAPIHIVCMVSISSHIGSPLCRIVQIELQEKV